MTGEHVILVDAQGKPFATRENMPLTLLRHLYISLFQVGYLTTKVVTGYPPRTEQKSMAGVWTNSVCGHPQLGESNEDAVIRRCRYELGVEITPPESIYSDFRYRATDPNGIVENEVCPVFAARTTSALQINDDEVMDYQWCDLAAVLRGIDATPWAFSPWMVMQATNREARKRLSAFTQLK